MNLISCAAWVKRGVATALPDKVQLSPEELEGIINQNQNLDSDSDDEFHFGTYDDEDGDVRSNIRDLAIIDTDGKDPYLTANDEENSEKDDDIIKPDDNLLLFGHVEGDASILEVFVYNEREGSFYCHHDLLLPSFPLCIEWLSFDPSDAKPGNLCAVGSMSPIIEVWDLDVIDCLEAAFTLGCKASKKKKRKQCGHKDAVLDIAWNTNFEHVLASGSVDNTVLLWDLENGTPVTKLEQFNDKVQSLQWHASETQQLLTGSADKMARLYDCRVDDTFQCWEATGEVERVLWNHFETNYFYISTNNGNIECIDIRQSKHLWEIKAHDKEVTGLSMSSSCPGLLVTCSDDGVVKVWDSMKPEILELIWENTMNLGALQCLTSNPDSPFVFAIGGDNKENNFKAWNLMEIPEVANRFCERKLVEIRKNTSENGSQDEEMMDVTDDIESMDQQIASSSKKSSKKKNKN